MKNNNQKDTKQDNSMFAKTGIYKQPASPSVIEERIPHKEVF
jgi:hypothetical protein